MYQTKSEVNAVHMSHELCKLRCHTLQRSTVYILG